MGMVELIPILVFFFLSAGLATLILLFSFVAGTTQKQYPEKVSVYECGFDPFEDARNQFDIKFYLVAILFIVFDLEITYLFPWAMVLNVIQLFGFWTMIVFILLLTLGFVYEWKKGALN